MAPKLDFSIASLGDATIDSPVVLSREDDDFIANYVSDNQLVLYNVEFPSFSPSIQVRREEMLELAGPREKIFFNPAEVRAGIVTCGGLCPGLNDVIRAVVMTLWYAYGVRTIKGIRFGYGGFLAGAPQPPVDLTPDMVAEIHRKGGTMLGSSRGKGELTGDIVDSIQKMGLNMLFVIGGDGSQKGAQAISDECRTRDYPLAVVGIPKTIDNDLSFVQRSFGFDTAVSVAVDAVAAAHVEAVDAYNGIGLVKVMGRESGYIAAHTALSMNDVNFVLIPEIPFNLEGENGFLENLQKRIERRHHAVILIAEGAGQQFLEQAAAKDASGNKKLGDVGLFLKQAIADHFSSKSIDYVLKYIDPSYIIRSAPANPSDSLYCARLGSNAAHAAMAGKTKVLISTLNDRFVHIPIDMAVSRRNRVDPESSMWRDVVENTGQPALMLSGKYSGD